MSDFTASLHKTVSGEEAAHRLSLVYAMLIDLASEHASDKVEKDSQDALPVEITSDVPSDCVAGRDSP